jgi:hypothetical protein
METWKTIDNFPNYEVSSLGRVKSSKFNKERILKPSLVADYPHVILCINGVTSGHHVHRLVANAFLPHVEGKRYIDHKNRIKTDNRIENLQWCTASENQVNTENRKNNTGVRNIYKLRTGYDVNIRREKKTLLRKYCRTFEEAQQIREEFFKQAR